MAIEEHLVLVQEIMVMKHETNRERQDLFGESEEADGIQGSVGGAQAW
jgi:hypothetical protein